MPQSLSSILVHLVFSTKNRESIITPASQKPDREGGVRVKTRGSAPSLTVGSLQRPTEASNQKGYGAFSISQSNVEQLKRYIRNQKQHHRRITCEDEYRKVLKRYLVEFDERYVWD